MCICPERPPWAVLSIDSGHYIPLISPIPDSVALPKLTHHSFEHAEMPLSGDKPISPIGL